MRKLSQPQHGPYHVTALREPNISVTKVYQPQPLGINVHQPRVKPCPLHFPAGSYQYGGNKEGHPNGLLEKSTQQNAADSNGVNNDGENIHNKDDKKLTDRGIR